MVTIAKVAEHCGLSVATVSRVLNNNGPVKPATCEKVRRAIEELHYTPNQSARNLRRNESRIILALAPNFSNPYYSKILAGIGDLSQSLGYSVLICNTGSDEETERRFLELLESRRADGAIFLGCRKDVDWLARYAGQYPLVQCSEYVPGLAAPVVSVDNFAAARETVGHILSLGHTRIGMIGAANALISTELRKNGWRETLLAAGVEPRAEDYAEADGDYTFASGRLAAMRLLDRPDRPTAVFCVSDIIALSVIAAAQELGIRVPEELTVTGFDDVDYTTMFHPYLTTVAQPCCELGKRSLSVLLEHIEDPGKAPEQIHLPHTLTVRESSAAPNPN
ncbi:MAG: LacI family DNA-binding transcriptional regulator [Clostridia bacterium]|nr:LacI family DNA-binding transcriptional regulator [Clostridia bacterium]